MKKSVNELLEELQYQFRKNIKIVRIARGYSLEEMARRLNTKGHHVASYEKGINKNPRLNTIVEYSVALNISPDQIIGYESLPEGIMQKYYKNRIKNKLTPEEENY